MRNAWKCWCFTHYHLNWKWEDMMDNPLLQYCVVNLEECPTTGRWHYQGYLELTEERTRDDLMDWLEAPGVHLEPRHKSQTQAIEYCKKSETQIMGPWELGSLTKEQGKRNDVELVREQLKAGEGMRGVVRVATNLQSIKIAECILKYEEPKRDWKPHIVWYWGLTGCGKSREAHLQFADKDYFRKSSTTEKWFDGYDAHTHVIFDDFLFPENKKEYNYWLDVFDRYACVVQTKGGIRQFLAKEIIVTSSTNPVEALMSFNQGGAEFLRRIDSIYQFQENESPKLTLGKPI